MMAVVVVVSRGSLEFTFGPKPQLKFGPSYRRGNNGVSRYPSYQKIFGLTENFDQNYRYFVAKMTLMQKLSLFLS